MGLRQHPHGKELVWAQGSTFPTKPNHPNSRDAVRLKTTHAQHLKFLFGEGKQLSRNRVSVFPSNLSAGEGSRAAESFAASFLAWREACWWVLVAKHPSRQATHGNSRSCCSCFPLGSRRQRKTEGLGQNCPMSEAGMELASGCAVACGWHRRTEVSIRVPQQAGDCSWVLALIPLKFTSAS